MKIDTASLSELWRNRFVDQRSSERNREVDIKAERAEVITRMPRSLWDRLGEELRRELLMTVRQNRLRFTPSGPRILPCR